MQLVLADLLLGGIVLELCPRSLPPCSSLERGFLEQQLFQIVRRVEVGLLARRHKDRFDLLLFQELKVDRLEEGILRVRLEPGRSDPFLAVLLEQRADGVQAAHRHGRLSHWKARVGFDDLRRQFLMSVCRKGSLVISAHALFCSILLDGMGPGI